MLSVIHLRLKELFSYRLLIITLIVCPAIFGYFSSYALSEHPQNFIIAVYDADRTGESIDFINLLNQMESLNIIMAENETEGKTITDKRAVEGLLIIKSGFGDEIIKGGGNDTLEYAAAPGTNTSELISEAFSLTVIRMRSKILLNKALAKLSEQAAANGGAAFSAYIRQEPVVSINFHDESPALTPFISPKHGMAAIFMTLSFLVSIFTLPGKEKSFLSIYSRKALIMDYTARFTAVLLLFICAMALYFTGCMAIYGVMPSGTEILACAALALFCIGLGAVTALLIVDKRTGIYIFIPFLLMNMTIGGAIWGRLFEIPALFKLFLPTAVFLDACVNGRTLEPLMMTIIGAAFVFIGMIVTVKSEKENKTRNIIGA